MQNNIIDQGIDLMLYGMGTVAVFLTLLVLITGVMSKLVLRYAPQPEPTAPSASSGTASNTGVEPRIAKVIEAAIKAHRKGR